jgi:4-hydroxy-tetrahydrodipicolinate synthase
MVDETRGRVPILAGAAEANVNETIAACEHYHRLGVRAVAIVSPFYYKLSPGSVYAYFKQIADHSPVDVTLYNIPMFASPIDIPTFEKLALECPRVVAIKDSSGDLPHMIRMIQRVRPQRPDFSFLTGWDAALMPMLLIGCDGGTNATSGIVPEVTRKLYDLTVAHRIDDARELQYKLLKLFDVALYSADFPEGFRAALSLRGFDVGRGRQPMSQRQEIELSAVRDTLACLLAEEGYADEPVGGCPARGSGPASGDVDTIVQGVLAELKRRGIA